MRPHAAFPLLFAVVLLGALAAPAWADEAPAEAQKGVPFLWVVEGDTPFYLFGTTGLPDDRIQELDPVVEKAVEGSAVYVSEAPLDLASQMKVQMGMRIQGGKTLVSVLGDEDYARLKAVMPPAIPEMLYRQFSPLAAASILGLRDYGKAVMQGKLPIEAVLHARFRKAGKKTTAIETVKEQLDTFRAVPLDEQAAFLKGLVSRVEKEIENGESTAQQVMKLYLAGQVDKLTALTRRPTIEDADLEAKFQRILLDDRQARMVARLDKLRQDAPDTVHFVALGAGHFGGKTGLLKRLEKAGWKLHRVATPADLPAAREKAAATK